ncbi:MAG: PEP-CTERM sorting domain-containing protein [Opitutales bacterium]|nr:PEP-CTERM sorting domain-containing protein [Opitutales bacterium]
MKKPITLAVFLAASSFAANADPNLVASSTGGETITFENATGSITVVATIDPETLKATMIAGASVSEPVLVDLNSRVADIGLAVSANARITEAGESVIDKSGFYVVLNQSQNYSIGMGNDAGLGFETESFWTGVTKASVVLTYGGGMGGTGVFAVEKDVDGVLEYLTFGGEFNEALKDVPLTFDSVVFDKNFVQTASVYDSVVTTDVAKSMAISAIPEPSAFGLLAGVGVLALVAARRRRK